MVTETLSIKKCIDEIEPHLKDIMNNLEKPDTWTAWYMKNSIKNIT